MAGYGIYAGAGLQDPNQTQIGASPVQSFQANQDQNPIYTGPSGQNANAGTYTADGMQGPVGSTTNSGFAGRGGVGKADFYLPSNANKDLYSSQLDPFQMSGQLGGGQIRQEDIAALRQAQTNAHDSNYSAFASLGIDPTKYLDQYKAGNYNGVGDYFQQMSQRGPVAGVNYSLDPSFGLTGNIGDLNFDALRYNQAWDGPQTFSAFNPYLQTNGVDRNSTYVPLLNNFGNSMYANRGTDPNGFYTNPARQINYQGGPRYDANGYLSSYQGSYARPATSNVPSFLAAMSQAGIF